MYITILAGADEMSAKKAERKKRQYLKRYHEDLLIGDEKYLTKIMLPGEKVTCPIRMAVENMLFSKQEGEIALVASQNVLDEVRGMETKGIERIVLLEQGENISENIKAAREYFQRRYGIQDNEHILYFSGDLVQASGMAIDKFVQLGELYLRGHPQVPLIFALMFKDTLGSYPRNYIQVIDDYFNSALPMPELAELSRIFSHQVRMPQIQTKIEREMKEDGAFFANGFMKYDLMDTFYKKRKLNLFINKALVVAAVANLLGPRKTYDIVSELWPYLDKKKLLKLKFGLRKPIPLSFGARVLYSVFGHECILMDNPFEEMGKDVDTLQDLLRIPGAQLVK